MKNSGIKNRLRSAYIGAYKCSLTYGPLRTAQNEPNISFKCSMFRASITRIHLLKKYQQIALEGINVIPATWHVGGYRNKNYIHTLKRTCWYYFKTNYGTEKCLRLYNITSRRWIFDFRHKILIVESYSFKTPFWCLDNWLKYQITRGWVA
jgi:hypothetical protein